MVFNVHAGCRNETNQRGPHPFLVQPSTRGLVRKSDGHRIVLTVWLRTCRCHSGSNSHLIFQARNIAGGVRCPNGEEFNNPQHFFIPILAGACAKVRLIYPHGVQRSFGLDSDRRHRINLQGKAQGWAEGSPLLYFV